MKHANYLVYFSTDDIDPDEGLDILKDEFGKKNVMQLNSSTTFAIKVADEISFSEVQKRLGFSESEDDERVRGIVVEILPGHRNGWYSRSFWDFLKKPVKNNGNNDRIKTAQQQTQAMPQKHHLI